MNTSSPMRAASLSLANSADVFILRKDSMSPLTGSQITGFICDSF